MSAMKKYPKSEAKSQPVSGARVLKFAGRFFSKPQTSYLTYRKLLI
jgi:hypothetical protein